MKSGRKQVVGKAEEPTPNTILTSKLGGIQRSKRSYSGPTLKKLWGRAAGRCAMANCRVDVFVTEPGYDPIWNLGEMGHIVASSDNGPRGDPKHSVQDRDGYENLILLCRNCHGIVDGLKESYPVARLRQIKSDHEAWVRTALPERGMSTEKWQVLCFRGAISCDFTTIHAALQPGQDCGITLVKVEDVAGDGSNAVTIIADAVRKMNIDAECSSETPRIAVFPLAPVSACLFLGYALTSRMNVRAYQYHRDEATWEWPKESEGVTFASYAPGRATDDRTREVVFKFELTARINSDMSSRIEGVAAVYNCSVPNPSSSWLKKRPQLSELARVSREAFEDAAAAFPKACKWHIFYAGPAPGAVVVGQQLNPTMIPTVQLYEYLHPNHVPSIVIGSASSTSD